MKALCCSSCGDVVIKSSNDGTKIRSKVLVLNEQGAFAVCKGCGKDIQVPLKLDDVVMKSIAASENLKLYVKIQKK